MKFAATLIALSGLNLSASVLAATPTKVNYIPNKDYTVLSTPGMVDVPGKIEVREFFWYGCPHCYKLEPSVAAWLKTKPADVNFVRTPAALNPVWEQNARGYYAVDMMGMTDKVHSALFKTINENRVQLFDQQKLANFYKAYGVDPTKFNSLYNSFAVSGKISQGNNLASRYRLDGVPAMVVNGKYVVKGEDARVLDIVNYLVAQERSKMPAANSKNVMVKTKAAG